MDIDIHKGLEDLVNEKHKKDEYFNYISCILDELASEEPDKYLELVLGKINSNSIADYIRENPEKEEAVTKTLRQIAFVDGQTGLFSKMIFDEFLQRDIEMAKRGRALTILYIDADNFKHVNDTYGKIYGDMMISKLSNLISNNTRKSDIKKRGNYAARYGTGDDFVIVLPDTEENTGANIAERLREKVSEARFDYEKQSDINLTISVGIAQYPKYIKITKEQFLARSDKALRIAKKFKNKVVKYSEIEKYETTRNAVPTFYQLGTRLLKFLTNQVTQREYAKNTN